MATTASTVNAVVVGSVFVASSAASGGSFGNTSMWQFISIMQQIELIKYLDFDFAPNLEVFFEICEFSQSEFLPNSFEYLIDDSDIPDQDTIGKFDHYDMSSNFFINAGNML